MLNAIPFLGWFLSAVFAMSLAVPFYFIWNALAPTRLSISCQRSTKLFRFGIASDCS